jgi:hypothetical protein
LASDPGRRGLHSLPRRLPLGHTNLHSSLENHDPAAKIQFIRIS